MILTATALASALRHRELHVEYQPQVTLQGEVCGFEALVRWHRPGIGTLRPAGFLPLVRQLGLSAVLTEHVLDQVCLDLAGWRDAGAASLPVAVNIAAGDLARDDLAALVLNKLAEYRIAPDRLALEVTETDMAKADTPARRQLALLRTRGVRVAIDDFGTGWSTLARLVELPLDLLKIDRALLAGVPGDPRREVVLRHVVGMAADLDLDVLAEGVEHPAQLAWLSQAGIERFQGHLYHDAAPAEHWTPVLRRPRRWLSGWGSAGAAPLLEAVR